MNDSGKGDARRPYSKKEWDAAWERIFKKKSKKTEKIRKTK